MNKNCPEILQLRRDIEMSVQRNINTPADFEFLSGVIWERTKTSISTSTLKRLWGYIDGADNTRQCTLELLSKTLGYKSWKDYTEHLANTNPEQSDFLKDGKHICTDDLSIGDTLELKWLPNRVCNIKVSWQIQIHNRQGRKHQTKRRRHLLLPLLHRRATAIHRQPSSQQRNAYSIPHRQTRRTDEHREKVKGY